MNLKLWYMTLARSRDVQHRIVEVACRPDDIRSWGDWVRLAERHRPGSEFIHVNLSLPDGQGLAMTWPRDGAPSLDRICLKRYVPSGRGGDPDKWDDRLHRYSSGSVEILEYGSHASNPEWLAQYGNQYRVATAFVRWVAAGCPAEGWEAYLP